MKTKKTYRIVATETNTIETFVDAESKDDAIENIGQSEWIVLNGPHDLQIESVEIAE
ncbi:MAG: hypothetical protein ACO3OM_07440 [Alphaproteobacteria bacterium]